jgi:hypothetical protein
MLVTSCAPPLVAPADAVGETATVSAMAEVMDSAGNIKKVLRAQELAGMDSRLVAATNRAEAQAAVHSLRASLASMPRTTPVQRQRVERYSLMLDALSASTVREFHARVARLPVQRVRTERAGADPGSKLIETVFIVDGKVQIRVTRNSGPRSNQNSAVAEPGSFGALRMQDELPCAEDCDGDPYDGDAWATQQDRDDALAMMAIANADYDALTAEFDASSSAFEAWWAANHGSEAPPSFSLQNMTGGFGSLMTSAAVLAESPCASKMLGVAGRGLTTIASIFSVVALAASPEPLSKAALPIAVGNALGQLMSYSAAISDYSACTHQHYNPNR